MSKIALEPNASGTGTFSIASPDSNSNRTLTLPDSTGTLATTADIPAAGGMTLLGTIATTSGSSVTLSGLTLTDYKLLYYVVDGVGLNTTNDDLCIESASLNFAIGRQSTGGGLYVMYFDGFVDLNAGVSTSGVTNIYTTAGVQAATNIQFSGGRPSSYTTASTSVSFLCRSSTFFAGSILVYGVK